jgi:hypothetical protein
MKEKILALLLIKFAGVRKDGLAQLASSLSLQVADETEATALIEKMSLEKVNDFVKDWRSIVDKEVSEGSKTHETNLKKKFEFVEKKTDDDDPAKKSQKKSDDETPAWAKALIDQNKALADRLATFEGAKTTETRLQTLEGKFKDLPATIKAQKLADAKLFVTTMDDNAFNEYLTRTDTDIAALNQELADKGLAGQGKPFMGGKGADGVSSGVASFIKEKTDSTKTLVGKEL